MRTSWLLLVILFVPPVPGFGAQPESPQLTLEGKLQHPPGAPFRRVVPLAFLQGTGTPFGARELVDRGGNFRFRKLPPAVYNLVIVVPRAGEMRQSVVVSPERADRKGRVRVTIAWNPAPIDRGARRVSVKRLAVPEEALREFSRAERYIEKKELGRAEAAFKSAAQIAPHFSEALNELGVLYFQTQRYLEAEGRFREALRYDPESYPPLVNLGGALLLLQRFEESLQVNLDAVKARPDDPLANTQLGSSWLALGRTDKAEESLKRAIALEPGHFSFPHLRLARVYELTGDTRNLVDSLREFLRLHPEAPQAPQVSQMLEKIGRRP